MRKTKSIAVTLLLATCGAVLGSVAFAAEPGPQVGEKYPNAHLEEFQALGLNLVRLRYMERTFRTRPDLEAVLRDARELDL